MLLYFSADWVFPVHGAPVKNGVVVTEADGTIVAVLAEGERELLDGIQYFKGAIVPGFVNTHCHLELSHLKNRIPRQTGLLNFVEHIIKNRNHAADLIQAAMLSADAEMYANGIVAVGDISNVIDSKAVKASSKIYYHTFVEALGFDPEKAGMIMENAVRVKAQFAPLSASIVPHAPYSVSAALFNLIKEVAEQEAAVVCIHNQESIAENTFFEQKTGDFIKFYEFLGMNIDAFKPTGLSSLKSYLPAMPAVKIALVHNTFSDKSDVDFALQSGKELYWCICPNANVYIENSLPDMAMLEAANVPITIGTDSLASNGSLNILDEMKLLQDKKQIDFATLLQWATLNGAAFLGLSDRLGTIEKGKKPGLNLIQLTNEFRMINNQVIRLI